MKILIFLLVLAFSTFYSCQNTVSKNTNSKVHSNTPYVVLVSIDGLRHDYIQQFRPPTLHQFSKNSLKADSLIPIFPTKTFPNHYSIVTGLYAENHGLIANSFYDPENKKTYKIYDRKEVESGHWYQGEPLWVTARKQQMVTASYFWVGSEAPIKGLHPNHYFKYNGKTPGEERVDQIVKWLELPLDKRPHFLTLYFSKVDSAGHRFGPDSLKLKEALFQVDDYINRLLIKIKSLNLL